MRVVEEKDVTQIILKDKEKVEIMTLKGNPLRIQIECKDGTLLVDEISPKRIKEIKVEEEQIKRMKELEKKEK